MSALDGRVAVVAGATRGAGRGIACGLGELGATVYCTGRSIRGAPASGPDRPETIEETAEMVTARGGLGIHAQTDHTVPSQVETLFARVRHEQGRLDILINDIWGGDALTEWGTPFWELDLDKGFTMLDRAVNAHIITSRIGVPLMLEGETNGRLVVEITDGAHDYYRGNLFYDQAKMTPIRLAYAMSLELRPHGIAAVAVTPGFLRSEAMLEHLEVTEETWRDATRVDPHFIESETPYYVGRAIAALAADPQVMERTGQALSSWGLSREYDFEDVDGRRPDFGAYLTGVIAEALMAVAAAGGIPVAVADEEGREASLTAVEEASRAEFTRLQLAHLLLFVDGGFYGDALALGPEPKLDAALAVAERHFSVG